MAWMNKRPIARANGWAPRASARPGLPPARATVTIPCRSPALREGFREGFRKFRLRYYKGPLGPCNTEDRRPCRRLGPRAAGSSRASVRCRARMRRRSETPPPLERGLPGRPGPWDRAACAAGVPPGRPPQSPLSLRRCLVGAKPKRHRAGARCKTRTCS